MTLTPQNPQELLARCLRQYLSLRRSEGWDRFDILIQLMQQIAVVLIDERYRSEEILLVLLLLDDFVIAEQRRRRDNQI